MDDLVCVTFCALLRSSGGVFNVDDVLMQMVYGLEVELDQRLSRDMGQQTAQAQQQAAQQRSMEQWAQAAAQQQQQVAAAQQWAQQQRAPAQQRAPTQLDVPVGVERRREGDEAEGARAPKRVGRRQRLMDRFRGRRQR